MDGLYRVSGNLAVIQKLRFKADHGNAHLFTFCMRVCVCICVSCSLTLLCDAILFHRGTGPGGWPVGGRPRYHWGSEAFLQGAS